MTDIRTNITRHDSDGRAHRIAIAILAAGRGSRMGGATKQLVQFGEENLITRAIRTAEASLLGDVFVVLGYMSESIQAGLSDVLASKERQRSITIVHNPEWNEGIASSIRAAVKAVDSYDAVIFMTVDQPFVDGKWLQQIASSFIEAESTETRREVVASNYGEPMVPGIPALFASSKFTALSMLKGDRGAKQIILNSDALLLNSTAAGYDIDTTSDLQDCLMKMQMESRIQTDSRTRTDLNVRANLVESQT